MPFFPRRAQVEGINNGIMERIQFAMKLAYAITIHKLQGLTCKKLKVDIGTTEQTSGLTYVALSRVKKLEDLMLEDFDFLRLSKMKLKDAMKLFDYETGKFIENTKLKYKHLLK